MAAPARPTRPACAGCVLQIDWMGGNLASAPLPSDAPPADRNELLLEARSIYALGERLGGDCLGHTWVTNALGLTWASQLSPPSPGPISRTRFQPAAGFLLLPGRMQSVRLHLTPMVAQALPPPCSPPSHTTYVSPTACSPDRHRPHQR
jgi:hypothetical protein